MSEQKFTHKTVLIAGRDGKFNWGVDGNIPEETYLSWEKELNKELDQPVILSGGGGFGSEIVKLKEVIYDPSNKQLPLRVKLLKKGGVPFDPYINSWKISKIVPID